MIKAIFFDIDGTLVTSSSKALTSTREAIAAAQKKGVLCGVATGRSPVRIQQITDNLHLDMFITYNGQYVYTADEVIFEEAFQPEVLQEIVAFADERHRQILFGGKDKVDGSTTLLMGQARWVKKVSTYLPKWFPVQTVKVLLQKFSPNRRKVRYEQLEILDQPIYQCILFSPEAEDEKLQALFPKCSLQRSNPYSVDLIPKGGSKLRGIDQFLQTRGIERAEVMAFGDNFNDNEMLAGVGIGVAMGNGRTTTKQSADYITDTNEADGIAKALRHFNIIGE
ncbi:haloacid dehalogenase [Enterococcus sp. JM4C]|uniref:Cof-type HAD-IIB family hydrolase n=1 Tax=Candidatus Enterococcus huntleyi TaxID=1857217 RepID=UPI00137B26D1|nr:Cof-type HAD-IIB family hydrolase [Enterococcus sp. JM4C]KAF1296137.1 haloacid dehalogenase [Enterococcus sp. JM4C]